MQAGLVDIYQSNFGEPGNLWPAFGGLDLPYLLRDDQVAECVFDDQDFMAFLREGMLEETGNVRLMVISNSGGWPASFGPTTEDSRYLSAAEQVQGMKSAHHHRLEGPAQKGSFQCAISAARPPRHLLAEGFLHLSPAHRRSSRGTKNGHSPTSCR